MVESRVTTIPKLRRVYYDTYANLPTTNVEEGDLGYATDRLILYRWSGAAWQEITAGGGAEGHITVLGYAYHSIGQGTWVNGIQSDDQVLNGYFWNSSNADGDNLSYNVYLEKGIYTLGFMSYEAPTEGIIDFDIDGVEVASFDMYRAVAALYNVWNTQVNINIATAGLKTLLARVDGKNGASTGHRVRITSIHLWRTS